MPTRKTESHDRKSELTDGGGDVIGDFAVRRASATVVGHSYRHSSSFQVSLALPLLIITMLLLLRIIIVHRG